MITGKHVSLEPYMHGVDVDLVLVVHPIENQIITTEYFKDCKV